MNRKFISNSNYVFRKILNSEESLSILKNFIEAILNIKIKEIELNPYLTKKEKYDVTQNDVKECINTALTIKEI